ncbi:MAG: LytR family transcriptional regulator, partial [Calditrichaeota bacterium]|nr:LytR family transcriptional regulator [Calditrichota bacterium]
SEATSVGKTVSQMESLMKPTVTDVAQKAVADTVSVSKEKPSQAARPESPTMPTRVQVLNGCGLPGFAKRVVPILRERGFDVREFGNANHFRYEYSVVLDRTSRPAAAMALADSLGMEHGQVRSEPDARLVDIDLTLIIGRDYKGLRLNL